MNNGKQRVLFVCIGNSCRSQMAEGFARKYGEDVMVAASAGVAPAMGVAGDTIRAMEEKNIDVRAHFPKSVRHMNRLSFDLIVNMSGSEFQAGVAAPVVRWDVEDPIGRSFDVYREVRDRIELLVMQLILELRRPK